MHDRQQNCMFQDTCLMPVDIGQEALDQYFDHILNVVPTEGNSPVKLLSDLGNEPDFTCYWKVCTKRRIYIFCSVHV